MRYLFFLISFLYSGVFFLFYKFVKTQPNVMNLSLKDSLIFGSKSPIIIQSIFGNLLIESVIFLLIGIILFFYFSALKSKGEHIEEEHEEEGSNFSSIFSFKNILYFLKKFSYYIGFLLFYVSLYLMSTGFDFIEFSTFIMLLNVIIYVYFFASKYSKLSLDFLKVNSILFSLTYIFAYFYVIISGENIFGIFDFVNSFLIIVSFGLFLYYDKLLEKKKKFDESMLLNLSFYIFFVFLFYFYHYIFKENLLYWLSFLTTLFGITWFEALPRLELLKGNKLVLKYFGILFSYFGILFSLIYLIVFGFSYLIFIVLFAQIIYNIFIHKKYINFISFGIGIFLIVFLTYYLIIYFEVFEIKSVYFLLFSIVFSFAGIASTYYLKLKYVLENYVIHIFSYIANVVSILIFLIFNYQNFAIFYIGLLLLTESIFFFLSYNKLNIKKSEKNHHH